MAGIDDGSRLACKFVVDEWTESSDMFGFWWS